jgi:mannose-1-phosphate guanylyltransferase
VRIRDSILLDGVIVKDHALINNSIVGWESKIGEWSRLEGSPDYENPDVKVGCGMTILGTGVKVAPEIIIRSSIVLPHKDLDRNHSNQILL